MAEPHDRLRSARTEAGYGSAAAFAREHGFNQVTYRSHENGVRGIPVEAAQAYAEALEVPLTWLLVGEEDQPPAAAPVAEPVQTAAAAENAAAARTANQPETLDEITARLAADRRMNLDDFLDLIWALTVAAVRLLLRAFRGVLFLPPVRRAAKTADNWLPPAISHEAMVADLAFVPTYGDPGTGDWPVERSLLAELGDPPTERLAMAIVTDDGLAPDIVEGDRVLVDLGAPTLSRDGIYLLAEPGPTRLAVATRQSGGQFALTDGSGAVLSPEPRVAGRVVWLGHRLS